MIVAEAEVDFVVEALPVVVAVDEVEPVAALDLVFVKDATLLTVAAADGVSRVVKEGENVDETVALNVSVIVLVNVALLDGDVDVVPVGLELPVDDSDLSAESDTLPVRD